MEDGGKSMRDLTRLLDRVGFDDTVDLQTPQSADVLFLRALETCGCRLASFQPRLSFPTTPSALNAGAAGSLSREALEQLLLQSSDLAARHADPKNIHSFANACSTSRTQIQETSRTTTADATLPKNLAFLLYSFFEGATLHAAQWDFDEDTTMKRSCFCLVLWSNP